MRVFVDGVETIGDAYNGQILDISSFGDLMFGYDSAASERHFPGTIDEVRIYNRALSADEIRQHYNQKKPVLEMKFDEGSGTSTKDESFNNNDGTLYSGATACSYPPTAGCPTWTQGKFGSAIQFDGTDDYVDVPDSQSLNPASALTLTAWVKMNSFKTSSPYISAIVGKTSGGKGYIMRLGDSTLSADKVQFVVKIDSLEYKLNGNTSLSQNQWYYLVATYDGSSQKIYINGVLDASRNQTGTLESNSYNIEIGRDFGDNSRSPNGSIDSVRIYNYARTQDEILTDYNDAKAAHLGKNNQRDDGLVGYWNMEEGTGQTVYDRSGNSNNGTLGASTAVAKDDPVFTSGYSSSGPGGTALRFDGTDDYVSIPDNAFSADTQGTIMAWVKMNTLPSTGYYCTVVSAKEGDVTDNLDLIDFRILDTGALSFYVKDDDTANNPSFYGNTIMGANSWHHIAITVDSTANNLFVDGIQQSLTYAYGDGSLRWWYSAINEGTMANYIGRRVTQSWSNNFFSGSIDEVRIYNRALSADEIRQHYNQKKPILDMKFDEGSGTVAHDESFNNNDITFPAVDANKPSWSSP